MPSICRRLVVGPAGAYPAPQVKHFRIRRCRYGVRHFVFAEQVWQLGEVHGHASCLVARQAFGAARPHRLVLEIEIAERLAGGVVDDEALLVLFDRPKRWRSGIIDLRQPSSNGHGLPPVHQSQGILSD